MVSTPKTWAFSAIAALTILSSTFNVPARGETVIFQTRRGIGIPFAGVIRSQIDGSLIPPYFEPWRVIGRPSLIAQVKAAGFDTVRLFADGAVLLSVNEAERAQIYENLDAAIVDLLRSGLNVVFTIGVNTTTPIWNHRAVVADLADEKFRAYADVVGSVGRFLSRYDALRVAFEPFNEPPPPCHWVDRPQWSEFQAQLYARARAAAPNHTIVLTGPCWSGPDSLAYIEPKDYDENTIFTLHFYEPHIFTHQGAPWSTSGRYIRRLPYPPTVDLTDQVVARAQQELELVKSVDDLSKARLGVDIRKWIGVYFRTPMNREWVKMQVAPALHWADKNRIPRGRLWVGEFGVMRDAYGQKAAATEDRLRWLEDVRTIFEEAGVPWSVHVLYGYFGIIVGDKVGPLDPQILNALGLRNP